MKPKRWIISAAGESAIYEDQRPIASVLRNRGFKTPSDIDEFMSPTLDKMHDPFLLPDMRKIVERVKEAVSSGERIVIYGDYDVDGITSTSILMRALTVLNANVGYYIPKRLSEGYGLNSDAILELARQNTNVIITVDCGITSVEQAALAKENHVDLIITDHHECQETLPDAFALCNPKLPTSEYPFDMLAGAGIALKLAQAILGERFIEVENELFSLSAIGTIADLAPLNGENRIIAKFGLQAIRQANLEGVHALIEVSGIKNKPVTAGHVGFMIGPRINAVGRLEDAAEGVDLLLTEDAARARVTAKRLDELNQERQETERKIVKEALDKIASESIHSSSGIIVVWGKGWHEGVVGIVASRLTEKFYRPSIVLVEKEDGYKGSARSIEGYSIFDALLSQKQWLSKFGGHEQAAGLSLMRENLPALLEGLKTFNQKHLTADLLVQKLKLDKRLHSREINHDLLSDLDLLEPYGLGNPRPVFRYDHLKVENAKMIGKDASHLKLAINENYRLLEALQFKYGDRLVPKRNSRVDLAFQLELNSFNGVESIQLLLKDIRQYEPEVSLFNKTWYVLYLMILFDRMKSQASHGFIDDFEGMKWIARDSDVVEGFVANKSKLNVHSYEGLLELAYAYHDLGLDLFEALKLTTCAIDLMPLEAQFGSVNFDVPVLNSPNEVAETLSRSLDHFVIASKVDDLYFDRAHFAALYQRIKIDRVVDLKTLLISSQTAILDLIAIHFFEEAGFITLSGGQISINTDKHNKVTFEHSMMNEKLIQMKNSFIKVHQALSARSDL
ncbi:MULTISPECIES: single-stranded-DNA-specific exonuclease RecJ [unclassified Fusibacter]|uniref:single-stranded-DNA-specific exonuclease RecJ n=1 Tax=unclassified Fusibacter TaxID=2624464 RepID=UPI0010110B16|nr:MULTISPECIES: single-stranded-DNA-specific exonuclease RecJ [unclassified Fusibacter]MCK8059053.1 single-stranded-DNA-specific exonuclease RecJ [Fusibacter sp. A2]NPE22464.1 single-stranded-DNA-specific exonuclease RecJ [Fusibacter sp. A1]RXV60568.1 single-stranded-DNA-specific exonuclease RecJ [Fusibacter sp. A1]